jgi:hypothetical protein
MQLEREKTLPPDNIQAINHDKCDATCHKYKTINITQPGNKD